uniref:ABC1 domain-containing protein n=1 Tax=Glossina austeni TaxID=7395 RepID=A0A1A9VX69_GLOAU
MFSLRQILTKSIRNLDLLTNTNVKAVRIHYKHYIRAILISSFTGFVAYDGVLNEFTYCGACKRFLRSLKTAGLISIDYLLLSELDPNYQSKLKIVHQRSANRLLEACLLNGGLYIKVGQGFAAINHILPEEYTSTLSNLQDKCLPTSQADIQKVFIKDFGRKPEELFKEFDYKPVAAASIAQVFKAKLENGQEVAVKVQYNDLQKRFVSDLTTIIVLHDIIELFFKDYNFGWMLRDVRNNLVQELNFVNEAKNAERCAKDLRIFNFVYVPKVYWTHTTQRVLTLEWIDGYKMHDLQSIKNMRLQIKDVDRKLFQLFSEQIFNSGFVHADPHASNILVRKSSKTGKAELVLLDHGLYEELPAAVRKPLCEFWEATVLKDEHRMFKSARQLGINDYMKFAEVLFQHPIRTHGGRIPTKLNADDIEYMQKIAKQNFDLIMSTLKEMPRNMLFVIRNLNTIRAIGRMHGDVVDRPRVMACYAQRCIYKKYNSLQGFFFWLFRRLYFEYSLLCFTLKRSCLNMYFYTLYKLGRAPKSATTILKDLTGAS